MTNKTIIFEDGTNSYVPVKCFIETDDIEKGCLDQVKNLARLPFAFHHIALMPDCHAGYGMPIGGVMATLSEVIPNAVGVDIGCGMRAASTCFLAEDLTQDDIKKAMGLIRERIPLGFDHHKEPQNREIFYLAPDIPIIQRQLESAKKQIGTLGGGNHFIEFQVDEVGHLWFMLHSGSRNFGLQVAKEYHNKAVKWCERWYSNIPTMDLAFLPIETKEAKEYLIAMNYCLDFAKISREIMMNEIISAFDEVCGHEIIEDWTGDYDIHHNYAVWENHFGKNVLVHRKGATSAKAGELGIIPGSMGTSSYIVEGKGFADSFNSCSHGAGRQMGRNAARKTLNLEEEKKKMEGIVHGLRSDKDLDEAPGAYKDIDQVIENEKELIEVIHHLKPLGVIKT